MKIKRIIAVMVISMTALTACNKPTEPTEPTQPTEISGDTTINVEAPIMEAVYYPGGPSSEEEFNNGIREYDILITGKIYNRKSDKFVKVSEEDMDTIMENYERLKNGEYTEIESLICDYPSYEITISETGEKFESDAGAQIEEVENIFSIIWSY